ncbi:hypothetical protein [Achromobacter sp. 2789STDY5608615]|uniref:hypothetical protein n=1 Tax=Achromobacter sp. 2789STDY5608615 TaxID=1806492 RepID=UPI0012E2B973|nr:hypothetical protein [Achromobacter sp. 2789STDY5608615]
MKRALAGMRAPVTSRAQRSACGSFPKIVQNSPAQTQRASLLRSAMHMPENNYPQTYPTLEDMLVNTNITEIAGQQNPRRK